MGLFDPIESKGKAGEHTEKQLKEIEGEMPKPTPKPTPTAKPEAWEVDYSDTLKAIEEMNKKYPRDKEL